MTKMNLVRATVFFSLIAPIGAFAAGAGGGAAGGSAGAGHGATGATGSGVGTPGGLAAPGGLGQPLATTPAPGTAGRLARERPRPACPLSPEGRRRHLRRRVPTRMA
jgi:hypothetical protein